MISVLEIKAAIDRLTPREYAELMVLLHPTPDDEWDRQIAADAAAGRLDHLLAEARDDVAAGGCRPLEDLLAQENDEAER